MSTAFKVCPICETPNHHNAQVCTTCGASLSQVEPETRVKNGGQKQIEYDYRFGETDLLEASLRRPARTYVTVGALAVVMMVVGIAALLVLQPRGTDEPAGALPPVMATNTLILLPQATVTAGSPTATASPTPTVTFTPSVTPTPEPCRQRIVAGGSLIQAAINCGHRDQDVIPLILEMNGLADANSIQAGQEIFIPWPTPTHDPNAVDTATPEGGSDTSSLGDETAVAELAALGIEIPDDPFAPTATATLPAGVMWHTVNSGENIISIAVAYDADVKILSELNPQIDFARCEFGQRFGGPDCLVVLGQGQQIRVPAPTPTPTLSPTFDPNSTATPTATPTYNQPNLVSPVDMAVFAADEIVTLRWVPTASLQPGTAYRIEVTDETSGIVYAALTTDINFAIPSDWQGATSQRHQFSWFVSIVEQNNPDQAIRSTESWHFIWVGVGSTETE